MTTYIGRFSNGELVETLQDETPFDDWITLSGWTGWASKPTPHHRPYLVDGAVVWQDSRTLQDVRAQAWERIKASRLAAIDAPLATPYGSFDCGPADRTNITDAISLMQTLQAAGTPITVDFTLRDNSTVTLTTAQMVNVGLLLGQKVQGAYATGRSIRAQIQSPTVTIPELDAIAWPAPSI